jgi:glutathione S-transferase
MTLLYTFTISHFSEKARWALDFEGIPHDERRLLPGPHMPVIRRIAPKTTVPVLRHGRDVVQGSSAILDYVHERLGGSKLTPTDRDERTRAAELEQMADHAFGLGVQRILYSMLLPERSTVTDLWTQGGPWWGRAFYGVAYPGVARAVSRMYKTDPSSVERAKDRYRRSIERVDAVLAEQPYLGGDAPNRADIAVAALLAPMQRPANHVVAWPTPTEALNDFLREFQGGPTWKHVDRMYAEHRRPSNQAA